jgi:peptide/nickel transport system substrate-binding protein
MTEPERTLSRRALLKAGVAGGVLLGAGGALAACGSSSTSTTTTATTATTTPPSGPRRGGRLRVGLTGGASSDTVDAQLLTNFLDQARLLQLYDAPVILNTNAQLQLSLAEELTPNSDATAWTMRVRPGITFHNGKPLTADDIIFSFQRIMDPKSPKFGAPQLSLLDYKHLVRVDSRTVRFPFTSPFSAFYQLLSDFNYFIVPVGYDVKHPIGTGPFKFQSFTPGVQSIFVRNENYWGGAPYVDEVVISDFPDETSQVNALLAGQIDAVNALSAASMSSLSSQGQVVVVSLSGNSTPFTLRCDIPPFNDVRVRQAMKYLIDRDEMLKLVFDGHGVIGNDLFSIYDPDFDHNIAQRTQDVDKAKSLLKQAGQSGLTVQLTTAAIAPGTVQVSEVFAQQAKAAGVNVNLKTVTATDLFGPNFLKWSFAQDNWAPTPFFTQVGEGQVPGAPFNESHFDDARFNTLYSQALATVDAAKQREIAYEMQVIYWNEGGYIIPYFTPFIDAHSPKLHGVVPSKEVPLSNFGFKNFWFS